MAYVFLLNGSIERTKRLFQARASDTVSLSWLTGGTRREFERDLTGVTRYLYYLH